MKNFKQWLQENNRCWTGYEPVLGKKAFSKGSCRKKKIQKENSFNEWLKNKSSFLK